MSTLEADIVAGNALERRCQLKGSAGVSLPTENSAKTGSPIKPDRRDETARAENRGQKMIAATGNSAKATKAQSLASKTALMPSAGSLSARRSTVTALRRVFGALALLSLSACGSLEAIFDPDSEVVRTLELRDEALADYLGPYQNDGLHKAFAVSGNCLLYTSPSPRD